MERKILLHCSIQKHFMQKIIVGACCALTSTLMLHAQVDLINKVNKNQTVQTNNNFHFTEIKNLSHTPIENQGKTGTCWSFSTNSFLESEMIREGGKPVHLSKLYSARCIYLDKSENYLRMEGNVNYGDGGQAHDVVNMLVKYGAIPESVYSGVTGSDTLPDFGSMQDEILSHLKAWVQNKYTPANWRDTITAILDNHLGKVPATFTYDNKTYTPQSFAKEYVRLNPNNYIEVISQTNTPYWQQAMLMVPDNWAFVTNYYNVPLDDLTKIVDESLNKGYTVEWDTDCSEPYFSWLNSVAIVPQGADTMQYKNLDKGIIASWFTGPQAEMKVTPENRQHAYDDKRTDDDYLMHIIGLAKDQNGKEYYIVKNSWGTRNIYKGVMYVSKAFFNYKTVAIMINKNALSKEIRMKMKAL